MQITNATFATVIDSEGVSQHKPITERTLPKCPCTPKGLGFFFQGAIGKSPKNPFSVGLDVTDPKGEARHYDISITPNPDGTFEHCELLQLTFKRLGPYKGEVTLAGVSTIASLEVSLREW